MSHVPGELHTNSWRGRLYRSYVRGLPRCIVPATLTDMRSRAFALNDFITRHFPEDRNASIIDLGCGHGALIYCARKLGYSRIVGVDRSHEQITEAGRLGIRGVSEGDLFETLRALPDGSQDALVCFDVLEHFHKDEIVSFMDDILRKLKQGGRLIVHAPNGESPFVGRILYGDFTHEVAFTSASIAHLLLSSGFSRVQCFEDVPAVHGLKSMVRWLLWKLIRSALRMWLLVETGAAGRDCIFSQNLVAVAEK